ncbi:MAG: M16 family metallopeptidase [Bacteroidia bacterium]
MKKIIGLLIAVCAVANFVFAQPSDINQKLPLDAKIRTGVLSNGIKYYVRYNAKPEKRMELRMAINAGSTAEDDDQQGLAHFCEHMCFNGTKNFKKSELVDYLESIGTKFGAHLNAYTSFDETVYMMQVPTDSETYITKGLQILEDWAHNVTFDSVEIDKERGVVTEEWRLGQGAQERMRRKYWPTLFKDSRYAVRLPIGKPEILQKCPYETLRKFYRDWYRPDLMAVMAVGDFDVDKMEQRIKQQFSNVPKAESTVRKLVKWEVPDTKEFLTATAQDKEAQYTMIQLLYKQPVEETKTVGDYRKLIVHELYNGMINARLSELQKQADPPFIFAQTNYGGFVRNKKSYTSFAVVKQDGIDRGIKTLVTENERVKRFGFTAGELERQKKEVLRNIEKAFNEKDKTESRNFVSEYVRNFLENEPAPGIENEFNYYKKFMPEITLEEVNALSKKWITNGENAVMLVLAPEKEGVTVPADDKIKALIKEAQTSNITAYVDKAITKPLMDKKPAAGKIISEKTIPEVGVTELNLANGVRVFLKQTDFKNDEIMFTAFKMGGTSLSDDKDYQSADNSNAIVDESGVGEFDKISLDKIMQGKIVNVSPSIIDLNAGMDGSFSPQDIETAFQLIYLYTTSPRKDETAFKSYIEQQKGFLQNRQSSPEQIFRDTVMYAMSNYNFRSRPETVEMLKEVDLNKSLDIYKQRFTDANGWTYTFVGNFKPDIIKSFIEVYLGGIPSSGKTETFRDLGITPPPGKVEKTVKKGSEPKASVNLKWTGKFEFNRMNRFKVNALLKLLSIKLRENLREEKGGVYGVGASPKLTHYPKSSYEITIGFGCSPDNMEKLISACFDEISDVKKNGCNEKNLVKVKETFLRERETYLKENAFWTTSISQNAMNGENLSEINEYNKWVEGLKSEDFSRLAEQYFDNTQYKRFVLLPEK